MNPELQQEQKRVDHVMETITRGNEQTGRGDCQT